MTERNMHSSTYESRKLLFCLFSISISLLLLSCIFLLSSSNSSDSVLMLMLVNNTQGLSSPRDNSSSNFSDVSVTTTTALATKVPSLGTQLSGPLGGPGLSMVSRVLGQGTRKVCDPSNAVLRIFMYDLPPEFHFELLGWNAKNGKTWPDVGNFGSIPAYPGGLNLQHSIAYWLTLDLLSSEVPQVFRPCTAVRVKNSTQADVIFVPFFSSVSYNRFSKIHGKEKLSKNKRLQAQLVDFLMGQEEWKRSRGKDHLIVAHHPNSMLDVRRKLGSAMFVLADFGRYPVEIANIDKDIIAPYRHVVNMVGDDSAPFEGRPILVYFQGAIYRKDGGFIRQELYYLLKDEKDVHFTFGSARGSGISKAGQGMSSSKFCLNIAGDTPSSNRLFDAIASHCVPVIISDEIELPFEDVLDYSKFCIFVRGSDAVKPGYILNLMHRINSEEWTRMWKRLKEISLHFEYNYPSQSGDAVEMIWEAVSRKASYVRLKLHKESRFYQSRVTKKRNLGGSF